MTTDKTPFPDLPSAQLRFQKRLVNDMITNCDAKIGRKIGQRRRRDADAPDFATQLMVCGHDISLVLASSTSRPARGIYTVNTLPFTV